MRRPMPPVQEAAYRALLAAQVEYLEANYFTRMPLDDIADNGEYYLDPLEASLWREPKKLGSERKPRILRLSHAVNSQMRWDRLHSKTTAAFSFNGVD